MGYIESLMAENERLVVRTRQHWMVLAPAFLGNLFGSFLLALVAIVLFALAPALGLISIVLLALSLAPVFNLLRVFLDWWNEEYIVTNRRVVQAEGIINKHVIDSSLEKVNDVVLHQSWLGRVFDYGDIEILTASELGVNKLTKITHPVKFKTEMLNQKEALGRDEDWGAPRRADIPDLIAELDALRQRGALTEEEFQRKKAQLLSKM